MWAMDPLHTLPRLLDRVPAEVLVHSEPEPCPYIEGQVALMPLRLPIRRLQPGELDQRLEQGDRRHGALLYRPTCAECHACEAIRLDVSAFKLRPHHKRVLRNGDKVLRVELGPPLSDRERVQLFERHKRLRGLESPSARPITMLSYQRFLVDRLCGSFEMRYYHEGRLVGVAVTDKGEKALSAVYCYYDPELPKLSLGTYSILKQLELAKRWGMRHLYLGLYIEANEHMGYKARFLPHDRLVRGEWRTFEREPR